MWTARVDANSDASDGISCPASGIDRHAMVGATIASSCLRRGLTALRAGALGLAVFWAVFGAVCGPWFGTWASPAAQAADAGIIMRGDAVVTGFSGTKTDAAVPADVHPLDRTFIDLEGAAAQIFDLSKLGTAPRGQLSDVPAKLKIKASESGQVFGVTLDDGQGTGAPNAYLTATSMYGLHIVSKDGAGSLSRLVTGAAGAMWMPGQFGLAKGGTPGAIYKVDGKTGALSLFAAIKHDGRDNAGPGLGNITFDAKTQQVFVSDLETGMIHRLTLDGRERDVFDHGTGGRTAQGLDAITYDRAKRMSLTSPSFNAEDPATWGYADARRRTFGVAVNNGRLYYAVAEGPSVWSVSIDDEGDFGTDARIELEVKDSPSAITDILFDGSGMLFLAQRGDGAGSYDYTTFAAKQHSAVLRYKWDDKDGRWAAVPDEYAIGLPQSYRGTQGGIASNYGYDKFGNLDAGKCRQTLWSTGEHLREGDDAVKVSLGGAQIVHGLQGHYKSRVKPANAPPVEAWFTDYDSQHSDADAFGHIGDVAIYAPCDPAVSPEPSTAKVVAPPLDYIDPPVDYPGLIIDKRCHPGAIGGKIRCTINVTNVGAQLPSEDVAVKDVTKVMFGPGAGTIVPIIAAAPSSPGIVCSAVPSLSFGCTIPAVLLLPGLSAGFDVFIDTHDLALAGNLGFRNCATMYHPDGWGKACAEGGTDIFVEKIGPGTCLPGGTCKFGLKIGNGGTMPYNGDMLLADAMFVGGAVTNAPVTAVNPPIACSAGNTAQLPFTCVTHLSLMPGEEHVHWVEVTMPAPGGYWAQNCFGALDPALIPVGPVPPGLGGGGAGPGNPSCVWVHVKPPVANLKIDKTALNGGKCNKAGANLLCDYEIAIRNEDAVAFNGPLKIQETVPAGATLPLVSPPWGCVGGPPSYTCDTGAAVNIPAGGSIAFNARVSIPIVVSEASMCKVPNKAKIVIPAGGVAPNLNAGDDEAAAMAWTLGLFWEDPITHITFIMCDPTNLKVAKAAKGPCAKAGDGFACGYDVTVTNTGPDPYQGPVKLDEKFGLTPTNVTFGGDFTCAGSGAEYKCETPVIMLAKGASLTLTVKATMPDNGTCEAPNTATMTVPPVGSKGNGDGADDTASASASIPSPRCEKTSTRPLPPVVSRCPDGLPVPRSGKCPCPNGGTWSRASNSCDNGEPQTPTGCVPGLHETKTEDGRCICRDGYSRNDGRCVPDEDEPKACTPGPNEVRNDNGRCVCRDGFGRDDNGRCVRDDDPASDCKQRGWTWTGKRCLPPSNPAADCKNDGRVWTGSKCIDPVDPGAGCRREGGKWTGSRCIFPQKECPRGMTGKYPDCRIILPDPPKVPKRCPSGTVGNYPNCIEIPSKRCPRGMLGSNGDCYWPKPPKIEIVPKIKINPEIFKPKPRPEINQRVPRTNDGPSLQKSPGLNFNPGMFKKLN